MEYIIFLLTIQVPFLYIIWKIAEKHSSNMQVETRNLKKKNENITNFIHTLKLSIEKISEDLYGKGKVNARMFHIEKSLEELKTNFRQLEIYTGLNIKEGTLDDLPSSPNLKNKEFR